MKNNYLYKWKSFINLIKTILTENEDNFNFKKEDKDRNSILYIIIIKLFVIFFINKLAFDNKIDSENKFNAKNILGICISTENHLISKLLTKIPIIKKLDFNGVMIFENNTFVSNIFTDTQLESLAQLITDLSSKNYFSLIKPDLLGDIYELTKSNDFKKKSGLFYTSEFITDYICKSSLLYYLDIEPNISYDELLRSNLNENTRISKKLEKILVIDPSMGSGAFLTKWHEILYELNLKVTNSLDIESKLKLKRRIICNNLFGVDLNSESVSIVKIIFSLYLINNEEKDYEFIDLNNNFKAGNAIFNYDKHINQNINWEKDFRNVYENNNGFDIVSGNPPWGISVKKNTNSDTKIKGQIDSSIIFLKHHYNALLHDNGIISVVIPNELCLNNSYKKYREFFLNSKILELINIGFNVFKNVLRPALIITLKKSKADGFNEIKILNYVDEDILKSIIENKLKFQNIIEKKSFYRKQIEFKNEIDFKFTIWMSNSDYRIHNSYFKIKGENDLKKLKDYLSNGRGIDTNKRGSYIVCPICSYLNPPFGVGQASKISSKKCVNEDCTFEFKKTSDYKFETIFTDEDYQLNLKDEIIVPGIIGSDLQRFFFKRKFRACYYYGNKLKNENYKRFKKILWKKHSLYIGKKILVRKVSTGNLPVIIYHDGFLLFNQQIYCFQLKQDVNYPLKFFFALISSRLFYYYQLTINYDPNKVILSHFTQYDILKFPIIIPNEFDEFIILIDSFLESLTKFNEILLSKNKLNVLDFKDEITNKFNDIDELVFSLYGINDKLTIEYVKAYTKDKGFKII